MAATAALAEVVVTRMEATATAAATVVVVMMGKFQLLTSLTLRWAHGPLVSCYVASARRVAIFLQDFHQDTVDLEADLLFSGSRGGYGGGGYGGGGGGFGGGGDRMSNLGAGLQKQSWGKSLRNIQKSTTKVQSC